MREADPVPAPPFGDRVEDFVRAFKLLLHSHLLHSLRRAFGNYAAGDPIPGITRGIGNIVIGGCVHDDGASIGVKDRCLSRGERNTLHQRFIASGAVFVDIHIGHIARVRTVGTF